MAKTFPRAVFAVHLSAALKVRPFTSTEDSRYYLNGVSFEPNGDDGAVMAATDGHRLGAVIDRKGLCLESVIAKLPKEIKSPGKLLPDPWLVGVLTSPSQGYVALVDPNPVRDDDTPESAMERVDDCTLRIGRAIIDGTFPDWRRVVPRPKKDAPTRSFNADYIKAFGRIMNISGDDEAAPHLVSTGDPDFIGVLMPMRGDRPEAPDWATVPQAADPQAVKKAA
jgi:DNA polymerase-3 subunit beta